MKTMWYILCGMLWTGTAMAQSTVNATGGSHRKGNLRLDWSVGEMALVNTLSAPSHTITNGVIQPLSTAITKRGENKIITFEKNEIKILPNPTRNLLAVSMNLKHQGMVTIKLFDVLGTLLYSKTVAASSAGQIEQINMTPHIKGHYMLKVEFETSGYKHKEGFYKIIKVE